MESLSRSVDDTRPEPDRERIEAVRDDEFEYGSSTVSVLDCDSAIYDEKKRKHNQEICQEWNEDGKSAPISLRATTMERARALPTLSVVRGSRFGG